MLQCVAVCCSVLQCVAVCCSVLQCVAVCCSVWQRAAVCCSMFQCVGHALCVQAYFHKRALQCVADLQKENCTQRHFTSLQHTMGWLRLVGSLQS